MSYLSFFLKNFKFCRDRLPQKAGNPSALYTGTGSQGPSCEPLKIPPAGISGNTASERERIHEVPQTTHFHH